MQERRKLTRTRVLKSAKFLLGKSSVIDCVVRDLTNAGACVELPSTIDLRGLWIWRTLSKTGVKFI
jgi:hypothetical protein